MKAKKETAYIVVPPNYDKDTKGRIIKGKLQEASPFDDNSEAYSYIEIDFINNLVPFEKEMVFKNKEDAEVKLKEIRIEYCNNLQEEIDDKIKFIESINN